jgi:hypothetical protein
LENLAVGLRPANGIGKARVDIDATLHNGIAFSVGDVVADRKRSAK